MSGDVLSEGTVLDGTYRIVREIGRGGMGIVYEATHARLAGRYAVKVLSPEIAAHPEAFARFRREALVTSRLQHPGIVQVIDFNEPPHGSPYLVMELLDGIELTRIIARDAPMAPARVAAIVDQIASAVGAAHNLGIVHRDLKPDNVFVSQIDGREVIKVVDFGISKVRQASRALTSESALLGTPQYMAPEQVVGKTADLDARADQFALAAIAYEMLTGRCAFDGDSIVALVYQIVNVEPPPIAGFNGGVTAQIERVVRRALAKQPAQRFATVQELSAELSAAAGLARPPLARLAIPPLPESGHPHSPLFTTTLQASTGEVRRGGHKEPRGRRLAAIFGVAGLGTAVLWLLHPFPLKHPAVVTSPPLSQVAPSPGANAPPAAAPIARPREAGQEPARPESPQSEHQRDIAADAAAPIASTPSTNLGNHTSTNHKRRARHPEDRAGRDGQSPVKRKEVLIDDL